ncbi:hypothetical protein QBC38DRAFT_472875 [Podospora fimiseda]|uniref:Ecp2 effector protein domain-containing protein n=1 Tax=Podospora fimiseda TaxID=252190 RepID=A0AAN7BT65_9PEZI|nr:hypothetical protein QBC38DRAFT_472875 [Podospora fimiseda]
MFDYHPYKMRSIIRLLIALVGIVSAGEGCSSEPAVTLWSKPNHQGEGKMLCMQDVEPGKCVDLPFGTAVMSVEKAEKIDCCLLYRSPCPKKKNIDSVFYAHNPGLLHQRLMDDIDDLTPVGFDNQVRSVVCPGKVVCTGLDKDWLDVSMENRMDRTRLDGRLDLEPFWINLQSVPGYRERI